jgi:hypothetical protein
LLEVGQAESLPADLARDGPVVLLAQTEEQLDAWLGSDLPERVEVDVRLSRRTAPWLLAHRAQLLKHLEQIVIRQPAHAHLDSCRAEDVVDLAGLFRELALPVRVSGLPACLAPETEIVAERRVLDRRLFDPLTGRLDVRELAHYHVARHFRAKSVRCTECPVADRCEGAHVNMIRHQGLARLRPLQAGPDADASRHQLERLFPRPATRLATGRPPEPVAPSLPGFPEPEPPPLDPLAVIELERMERAADAANDKPPRNDD